MAGSGRAGVVLFNLGGPETLAEVRPFLVRLFSDRELIRLPGGPRLQPAMARLIAALRAPITRRHYRAIGGGSPQLAQTRDQAAALTKRLDRAGLDAVVTIAMRYAGPSTESAVAELAAQRVERLVALSLYPHYSAATTGSSLRELERVLRSARWRGQLPCSRIESYPDHPLYLDALADTVRATLATFSAEQRDEVVVVWSAHGLPQKLVAAGDPYVEHIERTRRGLIERLALPNREMLGYQSRTGPGRWVGPSTERLLVELGAAGTRAVLVVPLSFVSEHIETRYELDQLLAARARAAGIRELRRSPTLGTHPTFIEALATLVERELRGQP